MELDDPENGDVDVDSVIPGSLANFTCDNWFKLDGDKQLTCQPNGQWSDDIPTCSKSVSVVVYLSVCDNVDVCV